MRKYLSLTVGAVAVASLSACSSIKTITPVDYADAGTTAVGLSLGAQELNPVLAPFGPAAPIVGLVGKTGAKEFLKSRGYSQCEADKVIGRGSALGAGANTATLLGATMPSAILVGVGVALVYNAQKKCYETFEVTIDVSEEEQQRILSDAAKE